MTQTQTSGTRRPAPGPRTDDRDGSGSGNGDGNGSPRTSDDATSQRPHRGNVGGQAPARGSIPLRGVIAAETGAIEHDNRIVGLWDHFDLVTQEAIDILRDEEGHLRLFQGFLPELDQDRAS